MPTLLDQEIAHIMCVMRPSLREDPSSPILSAGYWRGRLGRLLESNHLTKAQLCSIDDLLLQLDQFDAEQHTQHGSRRSPVSSRSPDCRTCRPPGNRMKAPAALAVQRATRAEADSPGDLVVVCEIRRFPCR